MHTSPKTRRARLLLGFLFLVLLVAFVYGRYRADVIQSFSMAAASELELPRVRSSFSPKNQGDDAQGRYDFEMTRLRDPQTGRIPAGIRAKELAFTESLPRAADRAGKTGGLMTQDWTFLGPSNVGGRTRALAVDLDYNGTSNRRILAGGISGGIYRSEDDGLTWTLTTSLADLASVTCIAQDPSNHDVWYAGTGEFLGNSTGGGSGEYYGHGLFKSTNGGQTWSAVLSTRDGKHTVFDNLWDYVWNVAVHPSGAVFAATYGGVFRSTNGGDSWEYVLGRQQDSDPFNPTTDVVVGADGDVYAALSRSGSGTANYGVYRSTDVGTQWQSISPPGLTGDPYRMVLGPAPSDANTLFLLAQSNQAGSNATEHQLFRYARGAGTWTDLSGSIPNETGVDGNASFSTQGGYDQIVVVKPDNPQVVFIGGTNLHRSTDGGASWTRIGGYSSPANYSQFANHHSDQHSLIFLPTNPDIAISGHDGGLSKSANILGTPHNWSSLNNGYVTTQFYAVAMDPQTGGSWVIGGLQDNGTWGTQSTDPSTAWFDFFGGDGAHAAIAPGGSAFYVSSQNGNTFRLTPSNFAMITPAGAQDFLFINPFVLDPNDPKVMYLGEAGGVWRNSNLDGIPDGGQEPTSVNWTFLNNSAQAGTRTTAIAVSEAPANRLYFATTNFQTSSSIIRVDNASSNGAGTVVTPPIGVNAAYPSSIAVNPEDGNEVTVVYSNYNVESIWHSANGGSSWTNIEGNLGGEDGPSVRTTAIVPTTSGTLYLVGTSTGVYSTQSLNGGSTTWGSEGGDVLGRVVVDMIATRPADGVIVAGSHGRGVYRATIGGGGPAAVAAVDVSQLNIEVQPGNTGSTTFTLTNTGDATLNYSLGAAGKAGSVAAKHRLRLDPVPKRPSEATRTFVSRTGPYPRAAEVVGGIAVGTPQVATTDAPQAGDFLVLDDGDDLPDNVLGWDDGTPFQWGSRFSAPVGGFTLESFHVFMRSEALSSFPVSVYITDPDGNAFASGTVNLQTSPAGQWYEITLDPFIVLPEGQAFDIELLAPTGVQYPAGVDANGTVVGAGFYWVNTDLGGYYADLATVPGYANGAWLIRAEGTAGGGTLNRPPVASINPSKTQALVDETITFDGSGSSDPDGTIAGFSWVFGDGGSSTQQTPEHAFTQPGEYNVTLTVTDNEGATGQSAVQIEVSSDNQPPVAEVQASKIQALVDEEITFDASSSSDPDGTVESYSWQFGDGGSGTGSIQNHSYSQAGAYNVVVTVTDNEGATDEANVPINILSEPSRLTVAPLTGQLGPGLSQVITVTYDATGQVAGEYFGQVSLSTNGGNLNLTVSILVDPTVDVETTEEVADGVDLEQNYPNPFESETDIMFSLPSQSVVRLTVFDLNGRVVRTLVNAGREMGSHQVTWDGGDEGGRPVASGTYFYTLEATPLSGGAPKTTTRKMIVLR